MNKLTLLQILCFIVALFFVSCSSEPVSQTPEKVYSENTQKEFAIIEKNDRHTNPPYRAVKANSKPTISAKEASHEKEKKVIAETPVISPVPSQLSTKNQERLQEINQNLSFFCMKHRKDSMFKDEEHCTLFTKKVLKACEKKHKLINTVMVNCIKTRLKKRK